MDRPVPSEKQLSFMDWEFGVFFHFGIRSFYKHHRDWDGLPMPQEVFNPTELDCLQWLTPAKEAGARYAILVCKHHDGFANWPSRYTDYSVAHTPWKDGKGDVVREFTDACRRLGLKVGLYYSPAQWGGALSFKEDAGYDDYFINQISELLTNYGTIDYLWFDGCGSEGHSYDKPRIIRAIRSLQPGIRIFNMWDPDTRWVGNEVGVAPSPNPSVTADVDFSVMTSEREALDTVRFLPAECDFMMRDTWFDCEDNEDMVKSPRELLGLYEYSVGRGANFLLNIGPDRRGLLPEKDLQSLIGFGRELKRVYGQPVGRFGELLPAGEDRFAIESPEAALCDRLVLREDLTDSEHITAFEVYAVLDRGLRLLVYRGATVGHKAICVFPAIRAARFEVAVTGHEGAYRLIDARPYLS